MNIEHESSWLFEHQSSGAFELLNTRALERWSFRGFYVDLGKGVSGVG